MEDEPQLRLYLLGPPRVELRGAVVEITRRKALALLSYLAVSGEHQPRDRLAGLLWPESGSSVARKALRRDLSELKLALGGNWLEAERDAVGLRAGAWVDVTEFRRAAANVVLDAQGLVAAASLYRGQFLTGVDLPDCAEFGEWQFFEAEGLRQALTQILDRLVSVLSAQGEHEAALPYARLWLSLNTLHEPAHRGLMQLYAQLGQHAAAVRQYQVCAETLQAELGIQPAEETTAMYDDICAGRLSGPSRTGASASQSSPRLRHNLPIQTTSFVGREAELSEIRRLLLDEPDCRLLTLVGSGGIGKTRLALATAARMLDAFSDGVFFVSLAPVGEAEFIVPAIAEAMSFTFHGGTDPTTQLLNHLQHKQVLLVVDNIEHLLNGADVLSSILQRASSVRILVTSRERLNLREEWVYEVKGLPSVAAHNEAGSEALTCDGVQLFLQRARQVDPSFEPAPEELHDLMTISGLVEGVPLALELAAPWIRTLSCREIAEEIARNLDFLTATHRNVPERHRSLRVVFEQTWSGLSQEEQSVAMGLSVFRGGGTREAAEAVAGATLSLLASLVGKAVLHRTSMGRYELHELLRQFAESHLQSDLAAYEQVRRRHSAYFIAYLRNQEAHLRGPAQQEALANIASDSDNVSMAWKTALSLKQMDYVDKAAECLGLFYRWRGLHKAGEATFQSAADDLTRRLQSRSMSGSDRQILAKLLMWQGAFTAVTRGIERARPLFLQSLAHLDSPELAGEDTKAERAEVLMEMGFVSDRQEVKQCYEQSLNLYRAIGDKWGMATALRHLGMAHEMLGEYDQATKLYDQSLALRLEIGDQLGTATLLLDFGSVADDQGDYEKAERLIRQGLSILQRIGAQSEAALGHRKLGLLLSSQGNFFLSRMELERSISVYRNVGNRRGEFVTGLLLAEVQLHLGNYDETESLSWAALGSSEDVRFREGKVFFISGCLALARRDYSSAEGALEKSVAESRDSGRFQLGLSLAILGYAKCFLGKLIQAHQVLSQALSIGVATNALIPLVVTLSGIALLKAVKGEMVAAADLYARASRHPYIGNSRWFEEVIGGQIIFSKSTLPPEAVSVADTQRLNRDIGVTARDLLVELADVHV